jgi:hypothetical protein
MTPTAGGRICGQCDKLIVDFTRSDWAEIERIQRANHNAVCGMYTPQQLKHWGNQVPSSACSRLAATTAMLVSMGISVPTFSQTTATQHEKTFITGTVKGASSSGATEGLPGATIILKGTDFGALTDFDGNFRLDVTRYCDTMQHPILVVNCMDYATLEIPLADFRPENLKVDAVLQEFRIDPGMYFSVPRPTIWRRIKWRVRRWFSRKD